MQAMCVCFPTHKIKPVSVYNAVVGRSFLYTCKLIRRAIYMSKRARLIDSSRIGRVQREIEPRLCWRRKKGDQLSFRQIENPMLIARSPQLFSAFNFNSQLHPVFPHGISNTVVDYSNLSAAIPIAFYLRFRDLVDSTKGNFFVIHKLMDHKFYEPVVFNCQVLRDC